MKTILKNINWSDLFKNIILSFFIIGFFIGFVFAFAFVFSDELIKLIPSWCAYFK